MEIGVAVLLTHHHARRCRDRLRYRSAAGRKDAPYLLAVTEMLRYDRAPPCSSRALARALSKLRGTPACAAGAASAKPKIIWLRRLPECCSRPCFGSGRQPYLGNAGPLTTALWAQKRAGMA